MITKHNELVKNEFITKRKFIRDPVKSSQNPSPIQSAKPEYDVVKTITAKSDVNPEPSIKPKPAKTSNVISKEDKDMKKTDTSKTNPKDTVEEQNQQSATDSALSYLISSIQYYRFKDRPTIVCCITLINGTDVIGESTCIDPATFDYVKGQSIAFENAVSKIWPLEGYLARQRITDKDKTDD